MSHLERLSKPPLNVSNRIRALYWLASTLPVAGILSTFLPQFVDAWVMSLMLFPGAIFARWAVRRIYRGSDTRWHHLIYAAVGTVWLEYWGALVGYWSLFQLDPARFPEVIINPAFSLVWIIGLIALELQVFPEASPADDSEASITFISNRQKQTLLTADVVFIESRDRTVDIVTRDGTRYPSRQRISAWETALPSFERIHRSYLINPTWVRARTTASVTLRAPTLHETLPISRSYQ